MVGKHEAGNAGDRFQVERRRLRRIRLEEHHALVRGNVF
jgi:hypothetical protein